MTETELFVEIEHCHHERLIQQALLEAERLKQTVELIKKQIEVTEQLHLYLQETMHLE
jgi:hypothetical protein